MAWIAGDSFDYYATVADIARSVWDSATTTFAFAAGRFGAPGQAVRQLSSVPFVQKTIGSNEGTVFAALAYYRPGALSGSTAEAWIQFRDGATPQCTVVFDSGGNLVLKAGTETGTVLATYAGAFAQDVWTHFQIRVVISNTGGSMTVRKNGQTSDTYASATNLDTSANANNYANVVAFTWANAVAQRLVDDLLFYSGSAPAPNDWVGDVRAVCLSPTADTAQKNFTPNMTITQGANIQGAPANIGGNSMQFTAFTAAHSGIVTKVTMTYGAANTLQAQAALYAGDGAGGVPGTLLATTAVVTNPTSGANDFTFPTPPAIVQGRLYYLAYNDSLASLHTLGVSTGTSSYNRAITFASGFPNPAGAVTLGGTGGYFGLLTFAPGNVGCVSEAVANGDTDFVFSSNVNDADLYDMDDLPFTPQAIIGVVSKMYVKKSDAGSRSGQVLVKSGTTQVAGTDTVLGTTYTYIAKVDTVDPATGVAWTIPAVNAIQVGQKVTA
ncbi:MAG TPA: hypothetical protein VH482_25335 [Thermomicrobiales bacterium]|jgi:hypothetical protein